MTAEWRETVRTITDPTRPAPAQVVQAVATLDRITTLARANGLRRGAAIALELATETRSVQANERYAYKKAAAAMELEADEIEAQS